MAKLAAVSMAAAIDCCDAVVDLLDVGVGTTGCTIKIYDDTAVRPAGVDTAVPGASVLLATLTCSATAFGAAADNATKATATAAAIASAVAAATGTALWFRAYDRDALATIDGNVGTVAADMIIDTTSIVVGATVSCSSWLFSVTIASA